MENKDIFKDRIASQLAKWKNAIADLTAKLEVAEETAKTKLREQLDGLHNKRVQAEKTLEEISTTSRDAWESVKAGIEQGWANLTRTAKTAARKVRETMAHPDRDEEIRRIAYHFWLDEGCPPWPSSGSLVQGGVPLARTTSSKNLGESSAGKSEIEKKSTGRHHPQQEPGRKSQASPRSESTGDEHALVEQNKTPRSIIRRFGSVTAYVLLLTGLAGCALLGKKSVDA